MFNHTLAFCSRILNRKGPNLTSNSNSNVEIVDKKHDLIPSKIILFSNLYLKYYIIL